MKNTRLLEQIMLQLYAALVYYRNGRVRNQLNTGPNIWQVAINRPYLKNAYFLYNFLKKSLIYVNELIC